MANPMLPVPDWFSWENQGAGVAVADLGDGAPSLIVVTVDAGAQQNRGIYRVGRQLQPDGTIAGGWSGWLDVPDWFSWENQGAGVAVADLGDGAPSLIVFTIDDAVEQNQAFLRIGGGLSPDGVPAGGGGAWLGVPYWFSWENEGGDIAVARFMGARKLVVLGVEDPPDGNAGFYELVDLDRDPSR